MAPTLPAVKGPRTSRQSLPKLSAASCSCFSRLPGRRPLRFSTRSTPRTAATAAPTTAVGRARRPHTRRVASRGAYAKPAQTCQTDSTLLQTCPPRKAECACLMAQCRQDSPVQRTLRGCRRCCQARASACAQAEKQPIKLVPHTCHCACKGGADCHGHQLGQVVAGHTVVLVRCCTSNTQGNSQDQTTARGQLQSFKPPAVVEPERQPA